MKKIFIIRLDDISWDMNYEKFEIVRDILLKYNVKPIIGVIPHNEDKKLVGKKGDRQQSRAEFWDEIRYLQDTYQWNVALHGYNHVYVTNNSGILKKNCRSEFAGVPIGVQKEKIRLGKEIFNLNNINIDAFMAPAHSFDWNTIDVLSENGIKVITDGYSLFPYKRRGVLFVPQLRSVPKYVGYGVDTVCYHTNSMNEQDFLKFENFVKCKKRSIISFGDVIGRDYEINKLRWSFANMGYLPIAFAKKLLSLKRNMQK